VVSHAVKSVLKGIGLALGLIAALVPVLMCKLEALVSGRDELFLFWGQTLAVVPGLPGKYLRKAFYWLTLDGCALSCDIGFMSYFSDRRARVGPRVYIGFGVSIGEATLGEGCLIGSRVSILNGGRQHTLGPDGKLTPFDRRTARRIHVGAETWIGEAAVLMADVGSRCIVAAGSVVSTAVPDNRIVGGNPARFIGKTAENLSTVERGCLNGDHLLETANGRSA
jgi:virginiamycin A acetyltransferase